MTSPEELYESCEKFFIKRHFGFYKKYPMEAHDAITDAVVHALENYSKSKQYDNKGNIYGYTCQRAWWGFLTRMRVIKRQKVDICSLDSVEEKAVSIPSRHTAFLAEEVRKTAKNLDKRIYRIVQLLEGGYRQTEIACILGISDTRVWQLIERLRNQLGEGKC